MMMLVMMTMVVIMLMMMLVMMAMVMIARGINDVKAYRVPDEDKSTSVPSVARGALTRGHCQPVRVNRKAPHLNRVCHKD